MTSFADLEVEFTEAGAVHLGMMAGARRAADLRRDSRVAVHSPPVDPPEDDPTGWLGEAKLAASRSSWPVLATVCTPSSSTCGQWC